MGKYNNKFDNDKELLLSIAQDIYDKVDGAQASS